MRVSISDTIKSIERKLENPKHTVIYWNLTSYEGEVYDYYGRWKGDEYDTDHVAEDFYTRIMPLAESRGDLKLPKDIDSLYYDQKFTKTYLGMGREMSAGYTPYGIRRIDSYFCDRAQNLTSYEEFIELEKTLILCPHLHMCIKDNILQNMYSMAEAENFWGVQ